MTDVGSQSPETPAPGVLTPRSQENPPETDASTNNGPPSVRAQVADAIRDAWLAGYADEWLRCADAAITYLLGLGWTAPTQQEARP